MKREFFIKLDVYENSFGLQVRPSFDSIFMRQALDFAARSTCCRKKVGSVFVSEDNSQVLCFGYNGGYKHGSNECDTQVPGACGCLHSEVNGVTKATNSLKNSTCYVTMVPCRACAKLLINRDIRRVVYFEDYRDMSSIELMQSVGLIVEKF
jgi:dCMP deaminase